MTSIDLLPDDAESLKRRLLAREEELVAARASQAAAEAEAAHALAQVSSAEAMIAHYKLTIEKLKRALYGQRSERGERLLDQLELQLEELEATATEDALVAETVDATTVRSFTRKKTGRKPFPEHLPRERVVVPGPTACTCCGSDRLAKIGEDVTETLEVVLRKWKVIQTVREKFTCRACESIGQAPAPFHVIPRGWAGPNLLAMMLFEKYGQHQPINRQSQRYAREGVELSLSTLADQVGACTMVLKPLYEALRAHVFAAARIHGDDTPVPVLAPGKTRTGRLWTYVRDDRPFAGPAPPAACSSTRPIVAVSILSTICGASPGSSRPTPMPASTGSTMARVGRARSPKHAGPMAVVGSSNWPTRRCAREAGYRLSRSRQ